METIYIVEGSCGEWSDRNDWTVAAFRSEQRASEIVDKLNELVKFNEDFHKFQHVSFYQVYGAANPLPTGPSYPVVPGNFHELQNACAGGKGSPETKAEYKRLQKLHTENVNAWRSLEEEHQKQLSRYHELQEETRKEWFKENYNPPEHLLEVVKFTKYDGKRIYQSFDSHYSYHAVSVVE